MESAAEERLREALSVCYAIPFLDDVEDFVWEAVWSYSQGLPVPDSKRTKRLFDVVDSVSACGWSAKTLVSDASTSTCEFVIQRADVYKKADALGFAGLTSASAPQEIGDAVLTHWQRKVELDTMEQAVADGRVTLLIKNASRTQFTVIEQALHVPDLSDVTWKWTDSDKSGLQGRLADGSLQYRWYPNQKQLFETLRIPDAAPEFVLTGQRLAAPEFIEAILNAMASAATPEAQEVS